jgi:hypothetical protein
MPFVVADFEVDQQLSLGIEECIGSEAMRDNVPFSK